MKPIAYAYAESDPINGTDPTGLSVFTRLAGAISLCGAVKSPVNAGVMVGGMIGYSFGYVTGNEELMNYSEGIFGLPMENAVRDLQNVLGDGEGGKQVKINFAINGRVINENMALANSGADPGMLQDIRTGMKYASYANVARRMATTGVGAIEAISKGQWGQTSLYFGESLLRQASKAAAKLGLKIITAANHAESVNGTQSKKGSGTSNHSGTTTVSKSSSTTKSGSSTFAKVSQSASINAKKASNSVTHAVKNITTTVKQSVSSAVKSVKSFQ